MNCFPCFNRNKDSDGSTSKKDQPPAETPTEVPESSSVQTFNFRELAMATKNFRQECLLGEGGFGRVFKGTLRASGQVVAVKQLDRNGMQGNKEFAVEVMKLNHLKHPNLVNLIGYCADGDQRLLVYEYMPLGSLEDHLFGDGPERKPLDWSTRMKIASSAAQGLEYLHERANPPVMYGVFKPSNVLLNEDFEPKLSDVGLSNLGGGDGTNQPSSRVMDTFGYSAPEYTRGGEVTLKSDVYCFGIVLLELITGRRAIDTTRPTDEQNLVTWAQTFFRDPKRFPEMADPRLNKWFPATALNQAVGIAAMCLQDEPMVRPLISDVIAVLSCISMIPNDPPQSFAPPQQQMEYNNEVKQDKSGSESHSSSSSDSEGESLENTHSSQISDEESESGSDSESEDDDDDDYQSEDEESTCNSDGDSPVNKERTGVDKIRSRQTSRGKSKRVSSRTSSQREKGSSRRTVVTFKEPSLSSRYSASGKSDMKESSLGSSSSSSSHSSFKEPSLSSRYSASGKSDMKESSSGSSSSPSEKSASESDDNEQIQSRENGSSSTQEKRPKKRGTSESAFQLENGGHFDRSNTEPAQLRGMLTPDEV